MPSRNDVRFYAATDVGRVRSLNEDNYLVDRKLCLFLVADGMGGHAAGEVASALAVRAIHEHILSHQGLLTRFEADPDGADVTPDDVLRLLEDALAAANTIVYNEALADAAKKGMGTTLSALLLSGNRVFVAHVGDSRIYLIRGGHAHQLTEDHNVYNELLRRGKLTREQIEKIDQKHAVTRAIGVYEQVQADTLVVETMPGDNFVLCSDGLYRYLPDSDDAVMARLVAQDAGEQSAQVLIDKANEQGGQDNITAVVVCIDARSEEDTRRARKLALKREVLLRMPLFSTLSERELLYVMQAAVVRSYPAGSVVIEEGEAGEELFLVLSGTLRVSRGDAVLSHLGPGDHVGEMALVRQLPRSATVECQEDAELIVISRADFISVLRGDHELAIKLLWQFLGVLADRLDQTSRDLHSARRESIVPS